MNIPTEPLRYVTATVTVSETDGFHVSELEVIPVLGYVRNTDVLGLDEEHAWLPTIVHPDRGTYALTERQASPTVERIDDDTYDVVLGVRPLGRNDLTFYTQVEADARALTRAFIALQEVANVVH